MTTTASGSPPERPWTLWTLVKERRVARAVARPCPNGHEFLLYVGGHLIQTLTCLDGAAQSLADVTKDFHALFVEQGWRPSDDSAPSDR